MLRHQDSRIAIFLAWTLGPLWGSMAFFYLGTMWASESVLDLRLPDIDFGLKTGAIGLLLGIVFAIVVTIFYPPAINREFREMEEHDHHH